MDEKRKKKVRDLLFEVALLYAGLLIMLFFFQRQMLYAPDTTHPSRAAFGVGDMTTIAVTTADGLKLEGWYKAPADKAKPVIVLFHGNAANIGIRGYKARVLMDAGYGVLLAEYRGYGGNPGSPSEQGLYSDARAYLDWLAHQGFTPRDIVIYGESIGTGVAVQMAYETQGYRAVVLESPFSSMAEVVQKHVWYAPAALLLKDRYDSIDKISGVKSPLLVIHGQIDAVVPYAQGKKLFDAANEPKKMETIPAGGHNDLYMHGAGARILAFLEGLKAS